MTAIKIIKKAIVKIEGEMEFTRDRHNEALEKVAVAQKAADVITEKYQQQDWEAKGLRKSVKDLENVGKKKEEVKEEVKEEDEPGEQL